MSGIFGIFNRDGKTVDKQIVETLLDATSYWKPDDKGTWVDGSVAFGHTMLWNTPESKYEHLPLQNETYVLTMDARIDNRDELAEQLELPSRPMAEIGDSEFVLATYKKWGEECPKYLLGDFAFAIWDEKKKQLFCARDHVGVKQFYYHLSDELFLFGNDLKGLTQYPNISQKINDEAVANYIVNHQLLSNTLTFFETFKKLPPAHTLTISHLKIEETCYWRLEDAPKVKLPNAEAYVKKLRELLEESVYARMRSDYTITSHLSGGLDSSSIAVLAARKLKEKGEKLLAFNWVPKPGGDDDPEHYEWANSKKIAEEEGIDHHYVSLTVEGIYKYMSERDIVYGDTTVFWYEYPIRETVHKRGSRTILTGWGGDEIVSYHGQAYYANLLLDANLWKLFSELNAKIFSKRSGFRSKLRKLYYYFLPIIPKSMYCKMPKVVCGNRSFTFVDKSFLPIIDKEISKPSTLSTQPQKTIREHMLAYWNNGHIQSRIASWESVSISTSLEYSYPLLDRRILEFILGIPGEYFVNNGVGRYLFQSATANLFKDGLKIEKFNEPNRVEKLINLTLIACKQFVKQKGKKKKESLNYINKDELEYVLANIEFRTMDKKSMYMIEDIETIIPLYFL